MENLKELRLRYQGWIERDRNPERMSAVIDFLFTRPLFSVGQLASELGIPFPAAQRYIDKLVKAQLLREMTGNRRNRIYQADEILQTSQPQNHEL
jgi:DNA-binding MarR family transcriptional regulator